MILYLLNYEDYLIQLIFFRVLIFKVIFKVNKLFIYHFKDNLVFQ